jgi:FemAB-related protein (PEP-CTERM system-associated)
MNVVELADSDRPLWDAYVHNAEGARVWHLSSWREVMQPIFGLRPHYLYAVEGGEVRGVLPLWEVKHLLSGHYFTSLPGGLCAEDELTARALVDRAKALVRERRARYLILRDSYRKWDLPELGTQDDHCTFMVRLTAEPEKMWRTLPRRTRNATDKATESGLEIASGAEHSPAFYSAYARSMRELGTPSQGAAFFRQISQQLPDQFRLLVVRNNPEVIGGGYIALFKDTVLCTWSGMLRQYYSIQPNSLLYWGVLKAGCEEGYRWADLGRSLRGSGTYEFKRKWAGEPQPLYQQVYLNGISQPPAVGSQREDDSKYRLFVQVWRRLPLPVAEMLGPRIRRAVPFG